jgi:hypothetical protein
MLSIDCKCGDTIHLPLTMSGVFIADTNIFKCYWVCIKCTTTIKIIFSINGEITIQK